MNKLKKSSNSNRILYLVGVSFLSAFLISGSVIGGGAVILMKSRAPFAFLQFLQFIIPSVLSFSSGFIFGLVMRKNGLLLGTLSGLTLLLTLILLSVFSNSFLPGRVFLIKAGCCIFFGAFGGLLGVNRKRKGRTK